MTVSDNVPMTILRTLRHREKDGHSIAAPSDSLTMRSEIRHDAQRRPHGCPLGRPRIRPF